MSILNCCRVSILQQCQCYIKQEYTLAADYHEYSENNE